MAKSKRRLVLVWSDGTRVECVPADGKTPNWDEAVNAAWKAYTAVMYPARPEVPNE
jgi:hypothetical protein